MTAIRVVELLKAGEVSALELLDALESRIQAVNPVINALPTLCFDRARDQARQLRKSGRSNSLLAGLPVAIKDLNEVSGVTTTFGSLVYKEHIPTGSDLLVEHIEKAGGLVYAKSNTPEFGAGGNTFNRVFGATRNPWNTGMSVAGSSGGAAAALATGMAWLAQGSDMGGSLRNPASFCGVVGLRPSIGRVASTPSGGIIDTLSTNGPMARNVPDLALMLDAMCGHEDRDPLSLPAPVTPFIQAARAPRLPPTIAWSVDLGVTPVDAEVRRIFENAIRQIEDSGIRAVPAAPDFTGLNEIFDVLRAHNYATGLGRLLKTHGGDLNPNVAWNIERGLRLSITDINRAQQDRLALVNRVQRFFAQYPLLLTPATIVPPYPVAMDHVAECDGQRFDNYYQWLSIAYAFTTALCPALSMPCGMTRQGLPVGLQIAAKCQAEALLLSAAAQIEQILDYNGATPINPNITHSQPDQRTTND